MSTHTQTSLFPLQEALSSPIARRSDPPSSKSAAHEVTRSGLRGKQQREILEAVRTFPRRTSRELTQCCSLDRYAIARRLSELERAGLVAKGQERECRIGHRSAVTWEAL